MKRALVVAWTGCLLMALVGCVTTSGLETRSQEELTPERQAEIVKKRFQERWDALMAKDYEKAYSYLSPSTRTLVSLSQFEQRFSAGNFKKVELRDVKCEESVCAVNFFLTYDHKLAKGITTPTGEKWFFQGGEAWFNLPE